LHKQSGKTVAVFILNHSKLFIMSNSTGQELIKQRLLAIKAVEDLLPKFEEKYPHDLRPRLGLEAIKAFLDEKITPHQHNAAWMDVVRCAGVTTTYTIYDESIEAHNASVIAHAAKSACAALFTSNSDTKYTHFVIGHLR